MRAPKKYRFFFHYRKCDGRMSVHFRGQCIPCSDVICHPRCETKRNTRQPYLVLQGHASEIVKAHDTVLICE